MPAPLTPRQEMADKAADYRDLSRRRFFEGRPLSSEEISRLDDLQELAGAGLFEPQLTDKTIVQIRQNLAERKRIKALKENPNDGFSSPERGGW